MSEQRKCYHLPYHSLLKLAHNKSHLSPPWNKYSLNKPSNLSFGISTDQASSKYPGKLKCSLSGNTDGKQLESLKAHLST